MNLADLVAAGEAMHEAIGREHYLTGAGLKEEPAFSEIYARFETLAEDEALEVVRSFGSRELLEWMVGFRIGRKSADLDEQQFQWEQTTVLNVNGLEVDYLRAPIELANSPDRDYRVALDAARSRASADGLDDLRRQRFILEHEEVASVGEGDYVNAISHLSGINLIELSGTAADFLASTSDMYADCLTRLVRRRLELGLGDLLRADVAWAFRGDMYDSAFRSEQMFEIAIGQMQEMGLDATLGGRVRFDTDERDGKRPRAFCSPVRVPDEVYLVLRPHGGHGDYRTFWHELGHAMHFASVSEDLPFAARWLGDNSVTEGFAMLWDHLIMNHSWIRKYVGLNSADMQDLMFEFAVQDLCMVRRYAAKLLYEISLHRSSLAGTGPEYAERLTEATLFRYSEHDCLADVDSGFYCARYLRAWQFEATLARLLTDRFDEDWFRNPRAGTFVQDLMARGQSLAAHELVSQVAGAALSFEPIVQRFESTLG